MEEDKMTQAARSNHPTKAACRFVCLSLLRARQRSLPEEEPHVMPERQSGIP